MPSDMKTLACQLTPKMIGRRAGPQCRRRWSQTSTQSPIRALPLRGRPGRPRGRRCARVHRLPAPARPPSVQVARPQASRALCGSTSRPSGAVNSAASTSKCRLVRAMVPGCWFTMICPIVATPDAGPLHHSSGSVRWSQVRDSHRDMRQSRVEQQVGEAPLRARKVVLGGQWRKVGRPAHSRRLYGASQQGLPGRVGGGPYRQGDPPARSCHSVEFGQGDPGLPHVVEHEVADHRVESVPFEGKAGQYGDPYVGLRNIPGGRLDHAGFGIHRRHHGPPSACRGGNGSRARPDVEHTSARSHPCGVQQGLHRMGAELGEAVRVRLGPPGPCPALVLVEYRHRPPSAAPGVYGHCSRGAPGGR